MKHDNDFKIPALASERHELIEWLYSHRMWEVPYSSEHMIKEHMVSMFKSCVDFETVYVDPTTLNIEKDKSKNTMFYIWVEAGPPYDIWEDVGKQYSNNRWGPTHDVNLDCGATTLEEALIKLAFKIKFYYNDDGTDRNPEIRCCNDRDIKSECIDDGSGSCNNCGYKT